MIPARRSPHAPRSAGMAACLAALLSGLLGLGVSGAALAHPHAWIDVGIELEADADDRVIALRQTWILDPTYSRYLYDDAMEQFEGATPEEKLARLAAEILDNLAEYDWYTEVRADDRRVFGQPEGSATLAMEDQQLHFRFRLRLDEAVDPDARTLRYAIFDPTYFIEILHDGESPPRFERSTGPCRMDIVKPRPDPAVVARALALDFSQTGGTDLGRHFAEQVTVHCD
ncbi:DUF1007 family protein [Thioalkalivibrio sp.]|uniref:DUF1007 family protein n=1 Tax=Thioalkalivibrio sp. TaxID=2093813 RepID=UPI003563C496